MRGFFVLLFITNLLFIGWQLASEPAGSVPRPYGDIAMSSEGLQLLSELDEEDRPELRQLLSTEHHSEPPLDTVIEVVEVEPNAATVAASSPSASCYQSNLLANLEEATALQSQLHQIGIEDTQRRTVQVKNINYWVMLKAYKDRAKANEAADILKQHRVKDFFIVRSGRYENAVSLGVYSTRERADARYKEIVALKARLRKPLIEAMELPAERLVLEFQIDSAEIIAALQPMLDTTKEPYIEKIPCN